MRCFYANFFTLLIFFASLVSPTQAVQIVIDYSRDASSLFSESTSEGLQARAAVEAAANKISDLLIDTLDPIEAPAPYVAESSGVTLEWGWSMVFTDPMTGSSVELFDETIAQDEYRVYAGGLPLAGSQLGVGSAGGSNSGGGFTTFGGMNQAEINEAAAIEEAFLNSIATRGEDPGFARWGGSMVLNSNANWSLDHESPVQGGTYDLYTTALHEIFHILGFGAAEQWNVLLDGSTFSGAESAAVYGANVPIYTVDNGHWDEGITSDVFKTEAAVQITSQETLMDPTLDQGARKEITELDAAGLQDLGWEISVFVIPEPSSLALLAWLSAAVLLGRSRQ